MFLPVIKYLVVSINKFLPILNTVLIPVIEYAVTENRMKQGIDKMVEMKLPLEPKTTGDYLRWIYNDVIKEEGDTMEENNINPKKIGSAISAKARVFWMNYLNSNF